MNRKEDRIDVITILKEQSKILLRLMNEHPESKDISNSYNKCLKTIKSIEKCRMELDKAIAEKDETLSKIRMELDLKTLEFDN
jgi:hypothetical protein